MGCLSKNVAEYGCEPRFAARDAAQEVLGAPFDNPLVFEEYGLQICTGRGACRKTFGSLQELEAAISKHLTESEKKAVLPKLTRFTLAMVAPEKHYAENKWRSFSVCAYPA